MSTIFTSIDAGDAQAVRAALADDPSIAAAHDEQGLTVLMRAAYRGGEIFELVRAADPPLEPFDRIVAGESEGLPAPDARTPDGFTPLHIAAFARNAEAARTLLEAGADPNVVATAPFALVTPLGTCAFSGANEVAALLLEHGAGPDLTGEHGSTPLDAAVANGNATLVELLRVHKAKRSSAIVNAMVAKSHGDVHYVRNALTQDPTLANAAWDWGGGDWETALGAAGHMGRRDIAEVLLANGARVDVFVAAMLGQVEVVEAMLRARPELRAAKGPHGIPLLAHAEAGGEQARAVVELLQR